MAVSLKIPHVEKLESELLDWSAYRGCESPKSSWIISLTAGPSKRSAAGALF